MPTEDQLESVVHEIERLQSVGPEKPLWDSMSYPERFVALQEIEWAGFSEKQEMEVIARVMMNEPPEQWMIGIDTRDDDPKPSTDELKALAEEIHQDEYAARVRDYGEADAAT